MVLFSFFLNKHGELTKLMVGEICSPGKVAHTAGEDGWMDGDEVMTSALKRKAGTAGCSSTEKRKKKPQPPNFGMLKERDAE